MRPLSIVRPSAGGYGGGGSSSGCDRFCVTVYTVTVGMRARSRDVLVHPQHGGRRCPEPLTQNKYCAYKECFQWQASDWDPCLTEVSQPSCCLAVQGFV